MRYRWLVAFALLVGALLFVVGAGRAGAATITVNTTDDVAVSDNECQAAASCSLRQAINAAAPGDTIALGPGTYQLTLGSSLPIAQSVTITGAGAAQTSIDGSGNVDTNGNLNRIMKISAGATVSIGGLTFTGGVDGNDENGNSGRTVNLNGGGAIFNVNGAVGLSGVNFVSNASNNPIGGAIANAGGSLAMTDVTFADNGAGVAGAMRIRSGSVAGSGVTFFNNFGEFGGGSVFIDGGSLNLVNSTIDSSAGLNGFGIGIQNAGGQVALTNVTIANSQGYALETDANVGASTSIENTIIGRGGRGDCVPAGRSDSVQNGTTGPAVTLDLGNNIDQTGDCGLSLSSDLVGDPVLAPLADNGGPTETNAVLYGSPAIGGGNGNACPLTDQRGESRWEICDIGAYEAQLLGQPTATTLEASGIESSAGSSSATLQASIDLRGEGGAYFFQWSTTESFESASTTTLVPAGVISEQTTVDEFLPGLLPGRTYSFRAVAENASGATTAENRSTFTTPADKPSVANGQTDIGQTSANLHFAIDPNGDDTSYQLEWGTTLDYGSQTEPIHIGSTPGSQQLSETITGLSPDTGYHVRVVASNGHGETDGGDVQFSTGSPPSPGSVYVDDAWSDFSNGDAVTGPQGQSLTFGTDAFATIGDAVASVNSSGESGATGQAIHVAPGSYFEEGSVALDETGEQLIGAGRGVTHVDLTQLFLDRADQVVQGLDLVGPGDRSAPVVTLEGDASNSSEDDVPQHAAIRDNRISGGREGIAFGRGEGADFPSSGSEVSGNEIFGNVIAVSIDGGSDNLILGNDIHDNGDASRSQSEAPQASVLILDNQNAQPTGNVVRGNTIANSVNHGISIRTSGNTIEDNTITGSGASYPRFKESSGIELLGDRDDANDNAISGNTITGSAFAGIKIGFSTDGNTITCNTITGTLHGGANGSFADPGAGGAAILFTGDGATNTTITGNTLQGNSGWGILQEPSDGGSSGNAANRNDISGNALGGVGNGDTGEAHAIDATGNWWGSADGPSGVGPGHGDAVSANVTFDPFLTTSCLNGDGCPTAPQPPTGLTVSATGSEIDLAWAASSGATGYRVYRATASDGPYSLVGSPAGTSFADTTVTAGTTYYYVVHAVSDAGESGDSSKTSAQVAQAQAPTAPAPVGAPTVVGQSVQNVTDTGATLAATIDPNGSDTHYVVKYGTTSSYGSQTSSIDLGQTPGAQHLTQVLTGLTAGTVYHFQFVATNSQGTSAGADATFTTLAAGTPPPLPPPVQGVSADVLPFLGTVLVNGKPLVAGQQIPFGAVVDTTNGTVLLESLSPSGEPIAAYFAGAIFVLTDGPDGTTTLVLQGGDFSVCSSKSKRHAAGAFGKKKPVIRSLWGNGHGQFATKGRFAAATVRGTIWNTQDRCDGTLITVDRGVVSVFDLVRKKTVTVTAGQSYLVSPPASAARSSVVASPAKVPADGSSSARITVTLRDSAGNPLAGKSVRIGGRNGLTTNADGIASITVSSTHPGTSRYTATDTTDGIQVGTVTVTFTKP